MHAQKLGLPDDGFTGQLEHFIDIAIGDPRAASPAIAVHHRGRDDVRGAGLCQDFPAGWRCLCRPGGFPHRGSVLDEGIGPTGIDVARERRPNQDTQQVATVEENLHQRHPPGGRLVGPLRADIFKGVRHPLDGRKPHHGAVALDGVQAAANPPQHGLAVSPRTPDLLQLEQLCPHLLRDRLRLVDEVLH